MRDTDPVAEIKEGPELCEYSARHKVEGVPATQMLVCGPLGKVPACVSAPLCMPA